jgi:glycine cleavage system transcriptional repressor
VEIDQPLQRLKINRAVRLHGRSQRNNASAEHEFLWITEGWGPLHAAKPDGSTGCGIVLAPPQVVQAVKPLPPLHRLQSPFGPVHSHSSWLRMTDSGPFTQDRMKELIIISAIGSDRTGLVFDVTRVILECGGNVLESRMTALGSEFAMLLLVSGNWHTLSKLESEFRKLSESANINISIRRTEARSARPETVTYSVDVVCLDQPGVVFNLAGFFSSRGIDIGDVTTRHFAAAHTGASMFSVQMVIHVPSKIHIAALREEFMELCDHMNLDAILEPFKA